MTLKYSQKVPGLVTKASAPKEDARDASPGELEVLKTTTGMSQMVGSALISARASIPVFLGMPKMLKELDTLPSDETGFLGHNGPSLGVIVQYWRSFDHLEAYARSKDNAHFPAWTAFNKRMKNCRSDVGI